jgi:hypothetical protein
MGHGRWLVSNWGHFSLFYSPPELLMADTTFNILNSQACSQLYDLGCRLLILSLENDRSNLQRLLKDSRKFTPLVTVYGRPPLFTSRLEVRAPQSTAIRGSHRDNLLQQREDGLTLVRSDLPICLFEHLPELRKLGVTGFLLDLRGERLQPQRLQSLAKRLLRLRCPKSYSTFNYLGKLA